MSITIKYFASLREQIGQADATLDLPRKLTAADVWQQSTNGLPLPPNLLVAINMEYVAVDHPVKDGDEVAFFPPVTGG